MRVTFIAVAAAVLLSACATETTPHSSAAAPAPAAGKKAPMCWSGDLGKFVNVGDKATNAGIEQICEKTSDGKGAVWMTKKH